VVGGSPPILVTTGMPKVVRFELAPVPVGLMGDNFRTFIYTHDSGGAVKDAPPPENDSCRVALNAAVVAHVAADAAVAAVVPVPFRSINSTEDLDALKTRFASIQINKTV